MKDEYSMSNYMMITEIRPTMMDTLEVFDIQTGSADNCTKIKQQ